jgi:drug/metabolite transporter (DMT)-like permease
MNAMPVHRKPAVAISLKLTAMAVIWGGTFVAGRIAAAEIPPLSAAFTRFLFASLALMIVAIRSPEPFWPPPRTGRWRLVLLALTGVVAYNIFFFMGLKHIDAGRASLIIANNPIAIMLGSALVFQERLTRTKVAGGVLSVAGAVVAITRGRWPFSGSPSFGWGEVLICGCVTSWVVYSLVGRSVMRALSPLKTVTYATVIGTLGLLPVALMEGVSGFWAVISPTVWVSLLYLGVLGTAVAFVWYYDGIRQVGPVAASQFINFVPVSAILLAGLLLSEPLTPSLAIGAAMVVAGVSLAQSPGSRLPTAGR